MGFFTLAVSLPMAVTPAVGLTLVARGDFTSLFLLGGGLTAVSLVFLLFVRVPVRAAAGGRPSLRGLFERISLYPSAVMRLLAMAYGPLLSFIALYAGERGTTNVGSFFTVFAAAGLLTLGFAQGLAAIMMTAVLYGIGFGIAQPSLQALVVHRVRTARLGAAIASRHDRVRPWDRSVPGIGGAGDAGRRGDRHAVAEGCRPTSPGRVAEQAASGAS